jgi:AAA domain
MSDALTSRAAHEYREERDRQEWTKAGPRLAVLHSAPPPASEEDYDGAQAPSAPIDDAESEREPSDPQAPKVPSTVAEFDDRACAKKTRGETIKFTPTPFRWRDPSTFPRRQFVYGRHYVRKFLSVTAAPTKVGKSSLALVEAVAMASGRDLLGGIKTVRPMRVWYWNGEDPQEELERRAIAICLHYGVDWREVEKNLFLDSGRDTVIIVATQTKTGAVIATPVEDALTAALIDGNFDVLILDPAVSVHRVSENDNMAIDAVAKTFGRIADKANVAVEAVHHTRKLGGASATIEDSRGASAWVSAARDVRVCNRMTKDESAKAGIEDGKERLYFRADTDGNLAPSSATEWFHLASQGLGNGSGGPFDDQDYVGVATTWKWPDAFDGVTVSDLRKVQDAIANGRWRENSQAKDWAGQAVAQVLKLDATSKPHKAKITALLKTWISTVMLALVEGEDDQRKKRNFIEVGTAAND